MVSLVREGQMALKDPNGDKIWRVTCEREQRRIWNGDWTAPVVLLKLTGLDYSPHNWLFLQQKKKCLFKMAAQIGGRRTASPASHHSALRWSESSSSPERGWEMKPRLNSNNTPTCCRNRVVSERWGAWGQVRDADEGEEEERWKKRRGLDVSQPLR